MKCIECIHHKTLPIPLYKEGIYSGEVFSCVCTHGQTSAITWDICAETPCQHFEAIE